MKNAKAYFCMPSEDYAPDKLIKLGQTISQLGTPWMKLSDPAEPRPEIQFAHKDSWQFEHSTTKSGSVGLFASFAAIISGIGVDASGNIADENGFKYKFDRLETQFIEPDAAYARAAVEVPAVKKFLEEHKYTGKSIYMITGVKIARGASVKKNETQGIGGELSATFDGTAAAGIPVQAGPKFSLDRKTEVVETFNGSSDFVFAYSLRKISVRWSGQVRTKQIAGGDLHGYDEDGMGDSSEEEELELGDIESTEVHSRDFGANLAPVGFRSVTASGVDDDGEDGQILFPVA